MCLRRLVPSLHMEVVKVSAVRVMSRVSVGLIMDRLCCVCVLPRTMTNHE
uniref:Uncharacterized protein n=1 Tax=Zea mays TaxID=4577 RepID=B4FC93_MAIZE|nr:unknown [Zea mays]